MVHSTGAIQRSISHDLHSVASEPFIAGMKYGPLDCQTQLGWCTTPTHFRNFLAYFLEQASLPVYRVPLLFSFLKTQRTIYLVGWEKG